MGATSFVGWPCPRSSRNVICDSGIGQLSSFTSHLVVGDCGPSEGKRQLTAHVLLRGMFSSRDIKTTDPLLDLPKGGRRPPFDGDRFSRSVTPWSSSHLAGRIQSQEIV